MFPLTKTNSKDCWRRTYFAQVGAMAISFPLKTFYRIYFYNGFVEEENMVEKNLDLLVGDIGLLSQFFLDMSWNIRDHVRDAQLDHDKQVLK